jgi:hypothetical protein
MEGMPDPTWRKILEGLLTMPNVESGLGLLSVEHRIAEIPGVMPAWQEFCVVRVRVCVSVGDM